MASKYDFATANMALKYYSALTRLLIAEYIKNIIDSLRAWQLYKCPRKWDFSWHSTPETPDHEIRIHQENSTWQYGYWSISSESR